MINVASKQKLVRGFNQVLTSLHNLKADIANEGKKAFMNGTVQDISELANLMSKINDINIKVEKAASAFKTYELDIVTETHPSEFPLINSPVIQNKYENEAGSGDVKSEKEKMEHMVYRLDSDYCSIRCIYNPTDNSYYLAKNSTFKIVTDKLKSYKVRHLIKNGDIDLVCNVDDGSTYIVTRDIKFSSANSLCTFVLNKRVRNGSKLLEIDKSDTN